MQLREWPLNCVKVKCQPQNSILPLNCNFSSSYRWWGYFGLALVSNIVESLFHPQDTIKVYYNLFQAPNKTVDHIIDKTGCNMKSCRQTNELIVDAQMFTWNFYMWRAILKIQIIPEGRNHKHCMCLRISAKGKGTSFWPKLCVAVEWRIPCCDGGNAPVLLMRVMWSKYCYTSHNLSICDLFSGVVGQWAPSWPAH